MNRRLGAGVLGIFLFAWTFVGAVTAVANGCGMWLELPPMVLWAIKFPIFVLLGWMLITCSVSAGKVTHKFVLSVGDWMLKKLGVEP